MAKKISGAKTPAATSERGVHAASTSDLQATLKRAEARAPKPAKPSVLLDTRVVYCGDNLESLAKLSDACVDLIYIDPPFNCNRNYGQTLTSIIWSVSRQTTTLETATRAPRLTLTTTRTDA